MKKHFTAALATLALTAIPVLSHAQGTATTKAAPPAKVAAPKALNATGTVSSVALDSLSVKGKTETLSFKIDTKTEVRAKGATHKTLALKKDGKTPVLTDFVKNGDTVAVTYTEQNGSKVASLIRVTASAPVK